jgi:phospholipid transport system substrate-binding protein
VHDRFNHLVSDGGIAMNMRHTTIILTSALLLWTMTQAALADAQSPEDMVKQTAEQVLGKLQQDRSRLKAHPDAIYGLIESDILPHFDFDRMSRWVLARYWRTATPQQRSQFETQFRNLLVNTYGSTLLRYSGEKISYQPTRLDPASDMALVRTSVLNPDSGQSIPIDYRVYDNHGEWKVVDLTIDGVSLVTNYRHSFAETLKQHGIDGLIRHLKTHNNEVTG